MHQSSFQPSNSRAFHERFMTFEEARVYLGNVKASTLRQWIAERRLPSYKPGKEVKFLKHELDKFMLNHCRRSNEQLAEGIAERQQELGKGGYKS
jgi:excisionase family DNA binding protein